MKLVALFIILLTVIGGVIMISTEWKQRQVRRKKRGR